MRWSFALWLAEQVHLSVSALLGSSWSTPVRNAAVSTALGRCHACHAAPALAWPANVDCPLRRHRCAPRAPVLRLWPHAYLNPARASSLLLPPLQTCHVATYDPYTSGIADHVEVSVTRVSGPSRHTSHRVCCLSRHAERAPRARLARQALRWGCARGRRHWRKHAKKREGREI